MRCPSAHRRPGYPLVGLRPRRARLRFTRRGERSQKRCGATSPIAVPIGKSNCRWLAQKARGRSGILAVVAGKNNCRLTVWSGFLLGDDKPEPIVVRATLPANYKQLGLSTKQKNDIYKIRAKYAGEIQELEQKIKDLRKQEKFAYENVLTPAQKARLQEIRSAKKDAADDDLPVTVDKKKAAATKDKSKAGPTEIKK